MYYNSQRHKKSGCFSQGDRKRVFFAESRVLGERVLGRHLWLDNNQVGAWTPRHHLFQHGLPQTKEVERLAMRYDISLSANFTWLVSSDPLQEVCEGRESHQQGKPHLLVVQLSTHRSVQLDCFAGDPRLRELNPDAHNSFILLQLNYFKISCFIPH